MKLHKGKNKGKLKMRRVIGRCACLDDRL